MKEIIMNLNSSDNLLYYKNEMKQGENNASQIVVVLNSEWTGYRYLIRFKLNSNEIVVTPELFAIDGRITYNINQVLTNEPGTLKVVFEAFNAEGTVIKSAITNLRIIESLAGGTEIMPEDMVPWYTEAVTQAGIATTKAQEAAASAETAGTAAAEAVAGIQGQFDAVVANVTVDSEVILARGTEATLPNRLDKFGAQINSLEAQTGKKIKVVACAIRNTGSGFELINDIGHEPIGVSSVTNDTDKITLNYNFTAKQVISLVVTPDEVMAQNGIIVGASVGDTLSNIYAYKQYSVSGYITKSGGNSPVYTVNTAISKGVQSASAYDAGTMEISHENYDLPNYPVGRVTAKNGDMDAYISSFGATTTRVRFKGKTKTLGGLVSYNGSAFSVTGVGISSAVWDSASSSLLITFAESFKNIVPSVNLKTDTSLIAKIYNYTANTIQIRFYDSSNTLITTASTEMRVFVNVSEMAGIDVIPYDGVYLFEKSGFAKMNPNNLTYAASNFWVYGIFEVE